MKSKDNSSVHCSCHNLKLFSAFRSNNLHSMEVSGHLHNPYCFTREEMFFPPPD